MKMKPAGVIGYKVVARFLLLFIMVVNAATINAQDSHPHILVKSQDKQAILEKINKQVWAKKVFDRMKSSVDPYVERHKTDPEWILSRYLMNRVPGKRYTQFFSDEDGTALVRYAGDAPFPTIRVSPHKRPPITKDGYSYKAPSIEELTPYDTSKTMLLQSNAPGGKKEWANPQTFVENINGRINNLALDAAIIYWLTGKEEYAKFAADILTQWAHGASYQNPIEGPCRTGFLSIQTLGDGHYEPMPLIYDFLYDFIRAKKYETTWFEPVFEKIAATMTFRGYVNNNWFAAQAPAMVFAALSLENKQRRDYYLDFYLNKDTVNDQCGHLAMPSVVTKWLTPDGHWKEPGGYHNFPVSSLLISAVAMENNGYNVFGKHPALLQSSYVLLKYSFPNFSAPSIGDTGPVSQSPECLELGMLMAKKYSNPIAAQLTAAMAVMIQKKGYRRDASDYLGLLTYLAEVPTNSTTTYTWPRSGELDFAKCYLQRNGTDRETGLMYLVQGATYNHNHANGMSLELYGAGGVMGIDPGKGITYEAPMHVNYYAQWAAHNTVTAGGISSSVPFFKGGGGTKRMGEIKLAAMEPRAEKEAVSPYCSFTDTRYTDISTKTAQQRTLAIIRTSPTSGYYVDIYRSAHPKSNEYIYHNIGNSLHLLDENRKPIQLTPANFPISKEPLDPPGFRLIQDYKTTGKTPNGVTALFSLNERGDNKYMQVLFGGEHNREFFSGSAPQSGTADLPYRTMPTPTIIARQEGEAWKRPFIAVFEPFNGANNYTVEKIENLDLSPKGDFSAIKVYSKNGSQQIILQSLKADQLQVKDNWKFVGSFGVINTEKGDLKYLYLGEGKEISHGRYSVISNQPAGSANVTINGNKLTVTCNQPTTITVKASSAKTVTLTEKGRKKGLPVTSTKDGISFTLPAVANGVVTIL
ncbi:heparinase II/III domain-containing protein [Segetibacter aerophilus]|nr:heparinase II/III family protein [Segetibacter aerophilus]